MSFEQEREAFIKLLNQDCEGEINLERIRAKQPEPHPCDLCGWSLDGHKYTYRYPFTWNGELRQGRLHLSCYSVVRGAQLQKLQRAARELLEAKDEGNLEDEHWIAIHKALER